MNEKSPVILSVKDLCVNFYDRNGNESNILSNVSFNIKKGETLALVGESGSGKSVTALAIDRLLDEPPAHITNGKILFNNIDLINLSERSMQKIRGNNISMIFQEPMTSLHPTYTVGNQIIEQIRRHQEISHKEARQRAIELLHQVQMPDPEKRIDDYPHKLSGGMSQRVMIAMALACNPQLLIADEISTALDVTVQAQILQLLKRLQDEHQISILFITHDLNVVAEIADRVVVMYSGRVVEQSGVEELFDKPEHPYTIGLIAASPGLAKHAEQLPSMPGRIPDPSNRPQGCQFHPRCPFATEECRQREPLLKKLNPGKFSACIRAPLDKIL